MTELADEVDIFTDLEVAQNPKAWFESLRKKGRVVKLPGRDIVAILGHKEGRLVYQDGENISSLFAMAGPIQDVEFEPADDITDQIEASRDKVINGYAIISQDPPEHTRIKSLLMGVITPKRVKENEEFISSLADDLIDAMLEKGTAKALEDYGHPLAKFTIADLLGVPKEDHEKLVVHVSAPPGAVEPDAFEQMIESDNAVRTYFKDFVAARRKEPKNDVMSRIAKVCYADGTLPLETDLVDLASLLFTAGEDTSSRVIIGAIRWIAELPELQGRLRADPELIPQFIEEVLRFDGPGLASWRLAKRDMKIGDMDVKAGTRLMVMLAAMNRDPEVFEDPAKFDIDRPNLRQQVAFARGPHACPGAPVARAEVRIALERLLARTSKILIDEEFHGGPENRRYDRLPSYFVQGLNELHIKINKA